MAENWNPEQYERYRNERAAPFLDLLKLVTRPVQRVLDLGCGTGELTQLAHRELGAAETLGIDASAAMLERAAAFGAPGLRFEQKKVEDFSARAGFDLVLSNATLHWVDDHPALFERITGWLAPSGQLALQMPANDEHVSQRTARELAAEAPFAAALAGARRVSPLLSLEDYSLLLARLGFAQQDVRAQVYLHRLADADGVFEWVKGSMLTWYAARLEPALFQRFSAEYRDRLRQRLNQPPGEPYLLTYRRIFLSGRLAP
jgi:trans-aconitate 2-methyltransferase